MYDISDDKRLRLVHDVAKAFGYSMQYSVFLCDLSPRELVELRWKLSEAINLKADSVAMVDLGEVDRTGIRCFSFLGKRPKFPADGPTVV